MYVCMYVEYGKKKKKRKKKEERISFAYVKMPHLFCAFQLKGKREREREGRGKKNKFLLVTLLNDSINGERE